MEEESHSVLRTLPPTQVLDEMYWLLSIKQCKLQIVFTDNKISI